MLNDICCIGHITLDEIITPVSDVYMPGGTAFYFSNAIRNIDVRYLLVTAVGQEEKYFVDDLRHKSIEVKQLNSKHTVNFVNIYPENRDQRTQKVLQKADPFSNHALADVEAKIFHLGPLLADDMDGGLIKELSTKGKVSLDVQGFLREVKGEDVFPVDWSAKKELLKHVSILKANESEAAVLTGENDIYKSAEILAGWGVEEVVTTLGSMGSVIYTKGKFYEIPAYKPKTVIDATGCGDTYMAGYLSQRIKNKTVEESGRFGAAMATIKIAASGPFIGEEEDVWLIVNAE